MKQSRWLTSVLIIQFLLFYLTVFYFIAPEKSIYFIGQYIFLMLLFVYLSPNRGFILLIAYLLVTSTIYILLGFINNWDVFLQLNAIINHFFLLLNTAVSYSTIYLSKQLEASNYTLNKKVHQLKHHVGSSELLTKKEFEERSKLIKKAMERRGERGCYIFFSLEKFDLNVQSSIYYSLTNIAIDTFRRQFDLVGEWNDNSFVILLQNTDESGLNIALNRFFINAQDNIYINKDDVIVKSQFIGAKENQAVEL